jgi:hypothetical protein
MERLDSYDEYRAFLIGTTTALPIYKPVWFPVGFTIYVWPTPTADITAGMTCYHSYLPTDLGGINYLTAGAAVNATNKVDIPCVNDFSVGDTVTIYGTTNYNGVFTLLTGTNPTTLRITHAYTAETFSTTDYCIRTLNETPNIPEVNDPVYTFFALERIASKDYAKNFKVDIWSRFAARYQAERAKLVHSTANLNTQRSFPR